MNNSKAAGKGVWKEQIQQWGTFTLMRTVKKTHNFKLREKIRMYEMGSKYRCVEKVSFQKTRAIEVYYWEGSYNKQQQSRWQGGLAGGNPDMGDVHTLMRIVKKTHNVK